MARGRTAGSEERLTLTVPEAARIAGIGTRTLWDLVARREIPVVRIGRRVLIVKTQLSEWLAARSATV